MAGPKLFILQRMKPAPVLLGLICWLILVVDTATCDGALQYSLTTNAYASFPGNPTDVSTMSASVSDSITGTKVTANAGGGSGNVAVSAAITYPIPGGSTSGTAHASSSLQITATEGSTLPTHAFYSIDTSGLNPSSNLSVNVNGGQVFGNGKVVSAISSIAVSVHLQFGPQDAFVAISTGGSMEAPEVPEGPDVYVPPDSANADTDEEPSIANETTGAYLTSSVHTVPVVAEHGISDFVWARSNSSVSVGTPSSWNAAYFFASEIPFTQFTIPSALPGGDSQFKIIFGNYESHVLEAGTPFSFTDYAPTGVTAFLLTGFTAGEGLLSGNAFPYTVGYRFGAQGPTFVRQGALSPGDYTLGGLIDVDDYNQWRSRFGLVGESSTDGNNDGIVNAADYIVWRKAKSLAAPGSGTTASIPEPATITLLGAAILSLSLYRPCRTRITFLPVAGTEFRAIVRRC